MVFQSTLYCRSAYSSSILSNRFRFDQRATGGVPMSQHIRTAMTLCSIAFCVLIVNKASSQVNTADILGTVSDPGGAVIPGVKITVTNTATNESKTAITTNS